MKWFNSTPLWYLLTDIQEERKQRRKKSTKAKHNEQRLSNPERIPSPQNYSNKTVRAVTLNPSKKKPTPIWTWAHLEPHKWDKKNQEKHHHLCHHHLNLSCNRLFPMQTSFKGYFIKYWKIHSWTWTMWKCGPTTKDLHWTKTVQ